MTGSFCSILQESAGLRLKNTGLQKVAANSGVIGCSGCVELCKLCCLTVNNARGEIADGISFAYVGHNHHAIHFGTALGLLKGICAEVFRRQHRDGDCFLWNNGTVLKRLYRNNLDLTILTVKRV